MNIKSVPQLQAVKVYQRPSDLEALKEKYGLSRIVELNANENPRGPSPQVLAEVRMAIKNLNRYPDCSGQELKKKLSSHFTISPSQIVLGNGSNEIIDLLIRAYCGPGDSLLTSEGAFLAYRLCAAIHGIECRETKLTEDLKFDLKKMEEEISVNPAIKLVFIANPNNPTGSFLRIEQLENFLIELQKLKNRSVLVVLDCAYWEYVEQSGEHDLLNLVQRFSNLIVLRTFSKIYALAGLRMGYGISKPEIIQELDKVRQPFNTNALAQKAAILSLADQDYLQSAIQANKEALQFWRRELEQLEVPALETQANFFLADFSGKSKATDQIFNQCLQRGVLFQPVANYGLGKYLRITTGTPDENQFAVSILAQVLSSY